VISTCETEKSLRITVDPAKLPRDAAQLEKEVARFVGIDAAKAAALIAGTRRARVGLRRDLQRHRQRPPVPPQRHRAEQIKARQAGLALQFTWKTPVLGGMLKTPHTMCLPFVFGNTAIAKDFTGTGPEQDALTRAVMGAWIAFARNGNPNHSGLPDWTPYQAKTRPTMIFDTECRLALDPKPEDRVRINTCPPFVSDMQWPMAG
jgi:para-nitrobenzyl esterase